MAERAQWLYDSKKFEQLHQSVASIGDTAPPSADEGDRSGQHFVAFVKGDDGNLWELEGSRVCILYSFILLLFFAMLSFLIFIPHFHTR
jgi:hypothetical protein